jgi:hypothetical protein
MKEGIDYEMIPVDEGNEQAWAVRFLKGKFTETVIRYGNIAINPEDDCLNFNFVIDYSPDIDLTVDNVKLQEKVADVLESVLIEAIERGSVVTKDPEESVNED